ncbi:MAG: efflux RND transporter periplasmic adaptor subunit [Planctomycetaceae bacterium]
MRDCLTQFPYRRRLASERPGILADVPEEGTRFPAKSVVATLRDELPRATLAVAEKKAASDAEIKAAIKAHELAKIGYDKIIAAEQKNPGTFQPDVVQQRTLDEANKALEVEVAQHAFDVAQLEVKQHQAELASYEIRTERGGVVTRVLKKDGEGVQTAEEVLEIVDTSVVRVEGFADARHLAHLKPGASVEVVVQLPTTARTEAPHRFSGQLGFVDVTLTAGQEVRVWADIDNSTDLLREGLEVELVIHPATASSATAAP